MIRLTRFGGEPFLLNAELIQYVEARPDTFITLANGERLIVAETMDEVLRRVMVYQQAKHLAPRGTITIKGQPGLQGQQGSN